MMPEETFLCKSVTEMKLGKLGKCSCRGPVDHQKKEEGAEGLHFLQ